MSQFEVVVVFADLDIAKAVSANSFGPGSSVSADISNVLGEFGVALAPIFDEPAEIASPPATFGGEEESLAPGADDQEMGRYFSAEVSSDALEEFAAKMRDLPEVETAYAKPPTFNPVGPFQQAGLDEVSGEAPGEPGVIPQFSLRQTYLAPAPYGVGAANAWSVPGGRGHGVNIIDIEGGWQLGHVDLQPNGGMAGGQQYDGVDWRNHGTAVMGEIIATHDEKGVLCIAPEARMAAVSHKGWGSARAINVAAAQLNPGDLLLLEMHRPGPRHNYAVREDQSGYIAVEWWPDDFLAIRHAVRRGVIVIEAAGNGAENFDDPIFDRGECYFPAAWQNPFSPGIDSGAVIVGAGAPASGIHAPPRSRLDFSNFGQRVDCQGWGSEVTTTGYGDLYAGQNEDQWFTSTFSGTSSASPIVAGVVAQLQGVARARSRLLGPMHVRQLLRSIGEPQQASAAAPASERIGRQPNVEAMIATL
ncbi:S8 family serine peptidase [Sphingomonadaceae bacterium]|nr:S8 family serine peptidase [Sphingomonadaceae bacterium]